MEDVIIIGAGEVGQAIIGLEENAEHQIWVLDKKYDKVPDKGRYRVMHVCIPYSKAFVDDVNRYMQDYPSDLVIVHSTLPVGTMDKLEPRGIMVHSPVRGKHPNLLDGLYTFVKYVGGPVDYCSQALAYFDVLDVKARRIGDYRASELFKLLDTSYYGWCIAFADRAKKLCDKYGANYDLVYKDGNQTYNEGYTRLGMPNVVRAVLTPPQGGVGGHCVTNNAILLDDKVITPVITALGTPQEKDTKKKDDKKD